MLSSPSTIRRFTPPTCTLEIKAKRSPLDRWTKRDAIKNLRFQLSFDDPKVLKEQQMTITGDRQQLEQLYTAAIDYTQNFLNCSFQNNKIKPVASVSEPHFQPQGLVRHQLFLGSLANKNSVNQIELSAVQLFDLVAALEEYHSQIAAVPELNTSSQKKRTIPVWGSIAALTLVAVGLTTGGIKLFQLSSAKKDPVAIGRKSSPSTAIPQLNEVVPPEASSTRKKSSPQPQLTEPLSSIDKLPPPPAVDLPKPQPNIPDPAQYPLPEVAKRSGFPVPTETPVNEDLSQTESTINVSPQPVEIPPQPVESPDSSDISDIDAQIATLPSFNRSTPTLKPEDFIAEKINPSLDEELKAIANLQEQAKFAPDDIPEVENELDLDIQEDSAENLANKARNLAKSDAQERSPDLPSEIGMTPNLKGESELNPEKAVALNSQTTQNAQLQEVTTYFQQKWRPPAKLTQSLEYRLMLNSDGSIQRIIPLGKVSEIYLDRTNMPLRGEAFISPLPDGKKFTIRLLLSPGGEVAAFAE